VDDPRLGVEAQIGSEEAIPIAIIVRKASRSDRPAIARFIEDAYGERAQYKATPRWTWQFIDNPFGRRHGDEVPIWVAVDGDRVVGQVAVQTGLIQVDGKTFEAGWAVDIMILRSYRGAGIGHRLHDAVVDNVDILMALTMAQGSRQMAKKHGCVTLAEVHQLTRWVRLDAESVRSYLLLRTVNHQRAYEVAQFSCNVFQFHRVFPLLANPLLRLRDWVKRLRRRSGATSIVEVDRFGPEIIFPRDAQFLNWRFVDCPEPTYRCFVARRGGRAVGYVVLRRAEPVELPQGVIADLYASRSDLETLDDLVWHSLAFFGNDVAAIDCGTSVAEFATVLRKHGFFRTWTHHPTCICRDSSLRERIAQLRNDWFFSKGDHDWDQIRLADPSTVAE